MFLSSPFSNAWQNPALSRHFLLQAIVYQQDSMEAAQCALASTPPHTPSLCCISMHSFSFLQSAALLITCHRCSHIKDVFSGSQLWKFWSIRIWLCQILADSKVLFINPHVPKFSLLPLCYQHLAPLILLSEVH